MKVKIDVSPLGGFFVTIDVSNDFATAVALYGRTAQRKFAEDTFRAITGHAGYTLATRGKRGVSNDGFIAIVRSELT